MPRHPNSMAKDKPTGPAPAISTGTCFESITSLILHFAQLISKYPIAPRNPYRVPTPCHPEPEAKDLLFPNALKLIGGSKKADPSSLRSLKDDVCLLHEY